MHQALARLSDLKGELNTEFTATDGDEQLLRALRKATEVAERIANINLMRTLGITEVNRPGNHSAAAWWLKYAPIESITSIKTVNQSTDFSSATALAATDYYQPYDKLPVIELFSATLAETDFIQTVYDGGYRDPSHLECFQLSGSTTQVGVRSGIDRLSDESTDREYKGSESSVVGTIGTELTDDDDTVIYADEHSTNSGQFAINFASSYPGTAHIKIATVTCESGAISRIQDDRPGTLPPDDLQMGVLNYAKQIYAQHRTGGIINRVNPVTREETGNFDYAGIHPDLVDAATRFRRVTV